MLSIDKNIHEMVLADRKVKVRELAVTTKISTEPTRHILGNILHMKKLSCRWVLRMLTPNQKHERESTSKECLDLLMRNRADFWRRLVTVDETWIHYYTLENREAAEGSSMDKKGYGVGFLGLSWHTLRGLPRKRKNHQQRVLLCIIGAIKGRNRCKTASHDAKKKFLFARQCADTQEHRNHG